MDTPALVVERSFAWIACYCHMSKDNKFLTASAGAMVLHTMFRLMLTRPAQPGQNKATIEKTRAITTNDNLAPYFICSIKYSNSSGAFLVPPAAAARKRD
jgi:hypothetical protein